MPIIWLQKKTFSDKKKNLFKHFSNNISLLKIFNNQMYNYL